MGKRSRTLSPLAQQGQQKLSYVWKRIVGGATSGPGVIPTEIQEAITRSVNGQKSYRYVLPTQILAKVANPELDCRAFQEGAPIPNAFDARSFCCQVIVPFDRANEQV